MKREPPGPRAPDAPEPGDRPAGGPDVGPLRFVVEGEARRVLSEAQIAPDPARLAAGWERRFIIESARAGEMVALYESLGYEVVADPIKAEDVSGDCEDCQLVIRLGFVMLYTRRPGRG